ncbi:Hypothetical predicted protein [Lecanosticta acicola]|uniref:Uncharacterized protein n=1 Tax=Lecanosticta acicola TaxID=111012 RepID=A0AAI8YW90_9PEZI|nr:Hypothetical predicted protein [Lecanosticta acicola]
MPIYNAVGVKMALHTAELEATLSSGKYSREKDAEAVAAVFERISQPLEEKPLGSRAGMHFIGPDEDMPMFLVQAGGIAKGEAYHSDLARGSISTGKEPAGSAGAGPSRHARDSITTDSHLISLGDTPSIGTPSQSLLAPLRDNSSILETPAKITGMAPQPSSNVAQAPTYRPLLPKPVPQALMLSVDLQYKTFLPGLFERPGGSGTAKMGDLKTEVFLNGQLAGYDFQNPRRILHLQESSVMKARFFGTRFARQLEKPWTYRSTDALSNSSYTAQSRWAAVAALLKEEAQARGTDKWGLRPHTAEYFEALSDLPLPDGLANNSNFGVIDAVVTLGIGRKARSSYIYSPERMQSSKFKLFPSDGQPPDTSEVSIDASLEQIEYGDNNVDVGMESSANAQGNSSMDISMEEPSQHNESALGGSVSTAMAETPRKDKRKRRRTRVDMKASAFPIPDLCIDSAVGYAEGEASRPTPYARHGEFNEERFVVGMRFIVI